MPDAPVEEVAAVRLGCPGGRGREQWRLPVAKQVIGTLLQFTPLSDKSGRDAPVEEYGRGAVACRMPLRKSQKIVVSDQYQTSCLGDIAICTMLCYFMMPLRKKGVVPND